jgi:hypothetical protein
MVSVSRSLAAASIAALALGLTACSKPAPAAAPSDQAALIEPASATEPQSSSSSSAQSANSGATVATAGQGECHQVQVGGGYQPGVNGAPGLITQGQTMTVCSPPPITAAPAPLAAAPAPIAPQAATPARAAPDTD